MYLDVKSFANEVRTTLRETVKDLPHPPKLKIYTTIHEPATDSYMKNKLKVAKEVGIEAQVIDMSDMSFSVIRDYLENTGVPSILQLPLRSDLEPYRKDLLNSLGWWDADGLNQESPSIPATALGISEYLKELKEEGHINEGAKAVIINRSELIGKPLIPLLLAQNFTVSVCHSKTDPITLFKELEHAPVIITAVGKEYFLNAWNVTSDRHIIIDAGITRSAKGITGDVDVCLSKHNDVTPVPGGVGQLTTTYLMANVVNYYR